MNLRPRKSVRTLYGSSSSSSTDSNDSAANGNRSAWSIGLEFYDQRDSFTTNPSIEHDGYGMGPALHPEEGSYAYSRGDTGFHMDSIPTSIRWAFVHAPSREGHHNHDPLATQAQYENGSTTATARDHHWWDRIKEVLHIDQPAAVANGTDARAVERQMLIDVEQALAAREDLDSSDIEVSIHKAHEVTLEGTVIDRRAKRIAEEICEGIVGVRDVQNRLSIRDDDPTDANVAFVLPLALLGGT